MVLGKMGKVELKNTDEHLHESDFVSEYTDNFIFGVIKIPTFPDEHRELLEL